MNFKNLRIARAAIAEQQKLERIQAAREFAMLFSEWLAKQEWPQIKVDTILHFSDEYRLLGASDTNKTAMKKIIEQFSDSLPLEICMRLSSHMEKILDAADSKYEQ
jgi:hypothetical protein